MVLKMPSFGSGIKFFVQIAAAFMTNKLYILLHDQISTLELMQGNIIGIQQSWQCIDQQLLGLNIFHRNEDALLLSQQEVSLGVINYFY